MESELTKCKFGDSIGTDLCFASVGVDAINSTPATDVFLSSIRSIGTKNALWFEFISMLSQANSKSTDSPIAVTQNYVCPLFVCCCKIYDIQQAKWIYAYHLIQFLFLFVFLLI